MRKSVRLDPYKGNNLAKPLNIILENYWYRSAMGFGSFEKVLSYTSFKRIAGNAKLYTLVDPDGNKYTAKAIRLGKGYCLTIKPIEKVVLR